MNNSYVMYSLTAMKAVLAALGIGINVRAGEPGQVIIDIKGVPIDIDRELIIGALNDNTIKPLTDMVTVNFIKKEEC